MAYSGKMMEAAMWDYSETTVEEVTNYTKAGGGCGGCHERIEEILAEAESPAEEPSTAA